MTRPQIPSAAVQDTAALVECPRPGLLTVVAYRVTRSGDRGASAVEFALVVPLLLVLVFGIIDFGVVFSQNLALNNAARDGARFAVVRQIDGSAARSCYDVLRRSRDAAVALAMPVNSVAVTVTANGSTVCSVAAGAALPAAANTAALQKAPCVGSISGTTDQLQVSTAYSAGLLIPLFGPSTITLTGNGFFRCEYS
jgi:Flp pilus assembly protein TadG